jgi:hypothetical protein
MGWIIMIEMLRQMSLYYTDKESISFGALSDCWNALPKFLALYDAVNMIDLSHDEYCHYYETKECKCDKLLVALAMRALNQE